MLKLSALRLFAGLIAGLSACAHAQAAPAKAKADHVVVISIDGLRPDAIEKADAPNMQALIKRGAYCPKAETIRPSVTLPSHTSMLTGLDYKRHGVTWNDYKADKGFIEHPSVFTAAKGAGRTTAMLYGKVKFHHLAKPGALDWIVGDAPGKSGGDTSCGGLSRAFAKEWPQKGFDLTFLHFREPDSAGHSKGWMTPEYLEAVAKSDAAVGAVVEAIQGAGRLAKTAIIISADHGGSGKGHGEDKPENTTIPWICVGPGVKAGLTIGRVVRTYDTAPTALAFIGVPPPPGIDGKPVAEVLGGR
jgi:predicted AlkP superfamily pyrophosphatase or phosphodiesterase